MEIFNTSKEVVAKFDVKVSTYIVAPLTKKKIHRRHRDEVREKIIKEYPFVKILNDGFRTETKWKLRKLLGIFNKA